MAKRVAQEPGLINIEKPRYRTRWAGPISPNVVGQACSLTLLRSGSAVIVTFQNIFTVTHAAKSRTAKTRTPRAARSRYSPKMRKRIV